MNIMPIFIRTIDRINLTDLKFDVAINHIQSIEQEDFNIYVSSIVVGGVKHFIYTKDLAQYVTLPDRN